MLVAEKLMTAEEFAHMPDDGKKYELVDGVPVEVCRPKPIHGKIQSRINYKLHGFVEENDLGETFVEAGVITKRSPDNVRGPDVGFISKAKLVGHDDTKYYAMALDLVVEVVSANDSSEDIDTKVNEYLAAGVRLIWIIYPATQRAAVFDDAGHYQGLDGNDGVLDGGVVVPGFKLPLKYVFQGVAEVTRSETEEEGKP